MAEDKKVTEYRTPELQDLIENLEPAYAALESTGFILRRVFVVKRTWSGQYVGEGSYTDIGHEIRPVPFVQPITRRVPMTGGGFRNEQQIRINGISKLNQDMKTLSPETHNQNEEVFYQVGEERGEIVEVIENLTSMQVFIRVFTND